MNEKEMVSIRDSLRVYREYLACIRRQNEKIEEINTELIGLKSPDMSGMPKGSGGATVTMEDLLMEKDILERGKEKYEREAERAKEKVIGLIDTVSSWKHNELLRLFFLTDYKMKKVAAILGCTERHAWRLYREALKMVVPENVSRMSVKCQ